jgi:hypothetical protein
MAARLRPRHQEDIKKKIQVANIITRLQKHINGEVEMSSTQVTSAKILLDKSLSNAPTELSGVDGGPLTVEIVRFAGKAP